MTSCMDNGLKRRHWRLGDYSEVTEVTQAKRKLFCRQDGPDAQELNGIFGRARTLAESGEDVDALIDALDRRKATQLLESR